MSIVIYSRNFQIERYFLPNIGQFAIKKKTKFDTASVFYNKWSTKREKTLFFKIELRATIFFYNLGVYTVSGQTYDW